MIEKGSTRLVIVLGSCVVKFPRFDLFLKLLRKLPRFIKSHELHAIKYDFIWCVREFKVGIDANRSEYKCWKSTKAKFLAKTYFSCVLVNIQEYESGIVPNRKDLWEVLKKIECKHEIWTVNPHCLDIYNFRKNEKGYMLIDYGDDGSGLPFSSFITRWYRDMEKILSF